jgi:hypothetical protein
MFIKQIEILAEIVVNLTSNQVFATTVARNKYYRKSRLHNVVILEEFGVIIVTDDARKAWRIV